MRSDWCGASTVRSRSGWAALVAVVLLTTGCSHERPVARGVTPPPATGGFDYQVGGGYPLYPDTAIVSRDRLDDPAPGAYNVCYVNAFQTQAIDLAGVWDDNRDLLLATDPAVPAAARPSVARDGQAHWVSDGVWQEILLDTGSPRRRHALLAIMRPWLAGCATAGFDAVEADNLDSYQRSGGRLGREDNLAFAALLAAESHRLGLAFAQKNDTSVTAAERDRVGFDFAVVEECGRYAECRGFVDLYAGGVLVVEYTRGGLAAACAALGPGHPVVHRDVQVQPRAVTGHVHATCH